MENKKSGYEAYHTDILEEIIRLHIIGQKKCSGEALLAVCEELAIRAASGTDAAGIYRRYLCKFLPDEIKNDL